MFHSILRSAIPLCTLVAVLTVVNNAATAQTQSLFGSRGLGNRTSTGFGAASTSTGSGGLLSSRMSSSALNTGSSGTSGLSSGNLSATNPYQGGFIGGNAAETFVGRNLEIISGATSQRRTNTRANRNNRSRSNQRAVNSSNGNGRFNSQAAGARRVIRPRQRVAFTFQSPSGPSVTDSLQVRLESFAAREPGLSGVSLLLDDSGILTIRGRADSEGTARFVEAIARLEPGVAEVRNELAIGSADSIGD